MQKKDVKFLYDNYPSLYKVIIGYWNCAGSLPSQYKQKHDAIINNAIKEIRDVTNTNSNSNNNLV
jgi:hypothetical protein